MRWAIKHKSGRTLFVTSDEFVANNRRDMGWIVEEVRMTSREQFEKWFGENFDKPYYSDEERDELEVYTFLAWRASRAAIEVELPDIYGEKYTPSSVTMDGFDFEEYLTDLYAAIEQANIKVKK